jgi:hypothetical protein
LLPEPDGAVLVVFKVPECSVGGWIIRVPTLILTAREGVHVQDRVYAFF